MSEIWLKIGEIWLKIGEIWLKIGEIWLKIGEIWLNSSSQKMPGLVSYAHPTVDVFL